MSVTLAQLARMTPEQQAVRLRGIDEPTRQRLLAQAVTVLAALVNEELRKSSTSGTIVT